MENISVSSGNNKKFITKVLLPNLMVIKFLRDLDSCHLTVTVFHAPSKLLLDCRNNFPNQSEILKELEKESWPISPMVFILIGEAFVTSDRPISTDSHP